MKKKLLLGVGVGAVAVAALLTRPTAPPAFADNVLGGAGVTITQSTAPPTLAIPSASPTLKAQPFAGGEGNGH
jgi:hypothetical protein